MSIVHIAYIVGVIGAFIIMDGVASLWTYWVDPGQTFWRDHALRLFRSFLGIVLVVIGWLI